jgi:hypothetical protein
LISPPQICHQKERERTTNQERTINQERSRSEEGEEKNRSVKKERKLKTTACVLLIAGDGGPHRQQERKEGKKSIQTPLFPGFSSGGPWRRRAATVHADQRRRLTVWDFLGAIM